LTSQKKIHAKIDPKTNSIQLQE